MLIFLFYLEFICVCTEFFKSEMFYTFRLGVLFCGEPLSLSVDYLPSFYAFWHDIPMAYIIVVEPKRVSEISEAILNPESL